MDDGSSDGTTTVAMAVASRIGFDRVRVMKLPSNAGKGYAVKSGVMAARGRLILMADADGATEVRGGARDGGERRCTNSSPCLSGVVYVVKSRQPNRIWKDWSRILTRDMMCEEWSRTSCVHRVAVWHSRCLPYKYACGASN